MDEIRRHLRQPRMMIPLQIPTNNDFLWFESGAKWISSIHSTAILGGRGVFAGRCHQEKKEKRESPKRERSSPRRDKSEERISSGAGVLETGARWGFHMGFVQGSLNFTFF